jgi:small-conductance mechanosensitive channel
MADLDTQKLIISGAIVAVTLLIGIGLRILIKRLLSRSQENTWTWDDISLTMLRGLVVPVAVSIGVWTATLILGPSDNIKRSVGQVLLTLLVFAASIATARLAAGLVGSITMARSGVAQSATIFVNITRVVVFCVGMLVLLQSLGVSITPLLTALGVGGLAVALALQDTLANLFAGIHILVSKKVQQGDYVRLDSRQEGYIVDINWRNTTIREISDNQVIVPNSRFADAIVTNYHRPASDMSLIIKGVQVAYDSDLDHVERVTLEVARGVLEDVEGGMPERDPLVRFNSFADSGIGFNVIVRTREFADQYLLIHEFHKRLHERYRKEGIEIPFPTRRLLLPERPLTAAPD